MSRRAALTGCRGPTNRFRGSEHAPEKLIDFSDVS